MLANVVPGEKIQVTETMDFVLVECCKCATPFLIPMRLKKSLIESMDTFYCPFGHAQGYYGKTEAERLKAELEQEKQRKAKEIEEWQNKYFDEINAKKAVEKKLKKLHNGVCPCCNRSFGNLQNHIRTQHPELIGKPKYVHKNKR